MKAFDLDEPQANYILDMQLRRLTKFSRIELESEKDQLSSQIAEYTRIVTSDDELRKVVADELTAVSKKYGTPRRTVLLGSTGITATDVPLEVPDEPCWILMSATGHLARIDTVDPLPPDGPRADHDVITSATRTTTRGEFGVITSAGRLIRARAIDLVSLPATATAPSTSGGSPLTDLIDLDAGERALAIVSLDRGGPELALGTRHGVVKRVNPELLNRDCWEVITLKGDDEVVGAVQTHGDAGELCLITRGAALLHFPLASVRSQGRLGGGVTGMRSADPVIWAGVVADPDSVVVTVAGNDATSGATGSVKVTAFGAYPGKGRGTKGMRCHRFLKGETALVQAWAGVRPAVACSPKGRPVELPEVDFRRDGSGNSVAASILAISTRCWSHPTASDPGAAEKTAVEAQPRSTAGSAISTDGPGSPDTASGPGNDGPTQRTRHETEQPDLFDE